MTISERIATNARWLCAQRGWKISDMEATVGVSAGFLSRVKGKTMLRIDTAYAIARYLDVGLSDLTSRRFLKQQRIAELRENLAAISAELAELEGEETCSTR